MRTHFTELQISSVGALPYVQREGEYAVAERALSIINIPGINPEFALEELRSLKSTLTNSKLNWQFYRGMCLGVNRHRVHTSLVPYALQGRLGRIYRVKFEGLIDFMCIIHCWRYHGVTMAGIDAALSDYQLNDEVPFEVFKAVIDSMWEVTPQNERVIFQDFEGCPVSIYNTPTLLASGVRDSVRESVDLSAYETMCHHIISCMIELPKSVALLGVSEDECYILDTTGRNDTDIVSTFSDLVFPRRYFSRYINFTGEITRIEDSLF